MGHRFLVSACVDGESRTLEGWANNGIRSNLIRHADAGATRVRQLYPPTPSPPPLLLGRQKMALTSRAVDKSIT